jgi:hypothetical protein
VLATEENSPCDAAGVLALEEEGLGLSVLETEDLGVTADEELTLNIQDPILALPTKRRRNCVRRFERNGERQNVKRQL